MHSLYVTIFYCQLINRNISFKMNINIVRDVEFNTINHDSKICLKYYERLGCLNILKGRRCSWML